MGGTRTQTGVTGNKKRGIARAYGSEVTSLRRNLPTRKRWGLADIVRYPPIPTTYKTKMKLILALVCLMVLVAIFPKRKDEDDSLVAPDGSLVDPFDSNLFDSHWLR